MTTEWVTVPREPTEAMIDAGTPDGGFELLASVVWQQMLAASPVPPAWPFDWKPTDAENIAAALSIAMHKHVPGWGGATDEQLDAVAKDLIAMAASLVPPIGWQPIETAQKSKKVIVFGQVPGMMHPQTSIARYWTRHTLPVAEGFEDEGWADVDDHGDVFMPEDWYEESGSEDATAVNLKPTHWMPLPSAPGTFPLQPPSPPRDEVVEALRSIPAPAIDQLRNHQTQLDMDGIEVGVSRQAIEEVLAGIDAALSKLEGRS